MLTAFMIWKLLCCR